MEPIAAWEGELEIRQVGGARYMTGRFPYNTLATIADRGRVRKETIRSRAFRFTIDEQPDRKLDLLVGHDFDKPIANRQTGTLEVLDSDDAVTFRALLGDDPPSWVVDVEKAIRAQTMTGLSPGFRVPPLSVVPSAETLIPEAGNAGVQIRAINEAVLRELSVVTSGAYVDAAVDLRSEHGNAAILLPWRIFEWL